MSRRRLVAIISAAAILLVGVVAAAVVLSVTQTDLGRDYVRRYLQAQVTSSLGERGHMYIGSISGGLLTGVVVDSFAIRDADDSLFVSAGPIEIEYDPRDIIDRRLLVSRLVLHNPFVNLRRHRDGVWNYRRIFPKGAPRVRAADRRFGDYIVIDTAAIHNGTVIVTMPWSAPDTLNARQRDSVLRYATTTGGHEIRETSEGLKKTWRWTGLHAEMPYARIADPDSAGRLIIVGDMDVDETDPPFRFRNVRGPVRIGDDTVRFDITHFDLPGSRGRARGMVHWKQQGPVRYDVQVAGDTVSLADIAWVYPTLPRVGGGRMLLQIENDANDPRIIDYRITRMDVRAGSSRLVGDWTFAVGGPVLIVKDVDLRAEPVDFDLFRTLAGGPFPVNWQGTLTGSVRGRGGRLDRFMVEDANITFRDKHVPGAVTRATGRGGLDILDPALTRFLGFAVDIETLDLRTPQFLFTDFPRLRGTISGTAVLDSSWLDLRFREADVRLRDAGPEESHFMGSGRVTYGEDLVGFDVDLFAQPIDFTQFARSYPMIPLRGPHTGPLRVKGTLADLELQTTMRGDAGLVSVDGRFDFVPPGFVARMTGTVEDLDVRTLLARSDLLTTRLTGQYVADLRGDSLANLQGDATISLDRSTVGEVVVLPSRAEVAFADGRVQVDTLRLATTAATLTAHGALSLGPVRSDSLQYTIRVDSLGGLRTWLPTARSSRGARLLATEDSARGARHDSLMSVLRDSLAGTIEISGALTGSIDSLATSGRLTGRDFFLAGDRARSVRGEYALRGLRAAPSGLLAMAFDTLVVSGIRLDTARLTVDATTPRSGRVALDIGSMTGQQGRMSVAYTLAGDTTRLLIDTVNVAVLDRTWRLAAPAHVQLDSSGLSMDSVAITADGARVVVAGQFPQGRPLNAMFRAQAVPLADLGALAQTRAPLGGLLTMDLAVAGLRDNPSMRLAARADTVRIGEVRIPQLDARATYADRRLDGTLSLLRDARPVVGVRASLPIDLALTDVERRLVDDTLQLSVQADSMDLGVLDVMLPRVTDARGVLRSRLDVRGTWTRPTFAGILAIRGGELGLTTAGIRLREIHGSMSLSGDSVPVVRLDSLVMVSGSQRGNRAYLAGTVRLSESAERDCETIRSVTECLVQRAAFDMRLRANDFEAIQQRRVAELEIGGDLHLAGSYRSSTLTGGLRVDRGSIYLRERLRKQIVDVDELAATEFGGSFVDTSFARGEELVRRPTWLDAIIRNMDVSNVDIAIGEDVWLRSQEASIKLGGSVSMTKQGERLTLEGPLLANRGTYRLYLGPVVRTFEVQRGVITFFGGPVIDPALDIVAVHTVRQAGSDRRDIRIRVTIGGTLSQPRLFLSSDERIQISETQILSYLVSGQPTFVAQNSDQLQTAVATLLPTVGALFEKAILEQVRFLDVFQFQTGTTTLSQQNFSQDLQSVFAQSRIAFGKQLTERTFLGANAGLCAFGAGDAANQRFLDAFGLTLEHRLNHGFSVQMSVEPATSAALCRSDAVEFNRPRQFGLDLFREWSF